MIRPMSPGAQDHDPLAHHEAFHVHEALGGAGGVDAGGAGAGNADGAPGAFPAAHGQDHGLGLEGLQTVLGADDVDAAVVADLQDHGVEPVFDAQGLQLADEALRVFGAGQFLLEDVQAEAVVDALHQDAPELAVPLEDQDVPGAALVGLDGGGQACWPTAHDDDLVCVHGRHSPIPVLVGPVSRTEAGRSFRTLRQGDVQLPGEDLHDPRAAESALAASHSGPQAPLDAVHGGGAGVAVDGVDDLPLGDALAAADDAAVARVLLDPGRLGLVGQVREVENRTAHRIEIGLEGGLPRQARTSPATCTAMAGAEVRPGDSMPATSKKPGAPLASPMMKSPVSGVERSPAKEVMTAA